MPSDVSKLRRWLPLILLLLIAFFLRSHQLLEIPPGLTHDEANHGREAVNILAGQLALFFPLNYGSEPLYSYTVAGHMLLLGRGLLALRLVNVFFGLLAVAATYRWGRLALGRRTALLGAALMALSFWPLASSREALRAGMMPFFTAGSAIFFWLMLRRGREGERQSRARLLWLLLGFTICLTATLYNYLAARVVWLIFPAFLLYLGLWRRPLLRRVWRPSVVGMGLAALAVTPMFLYLQRHPEAQTRLQMFGSTLQKLQEGELGPLLENAGSAFLAFFWPGYGDQFLAYNIPGRPVFDAVSAILFLVGIGLCLWRWRRPAHAFLLLWFVVGIAPSLITGPTANTTRNVGAMPAAFLLPAVGFVALAQQVGGRLRTRARAAVVALAVAWLAVAGWITIDDYFVQWAQSPHVRGAYQHILVSQLQLLDEETAGGGTSNEPVVISSVYPGPAHNPSIALVLAEEPQRLRWVDARQGLIVPAQEARLLAPSSTPLHPAFARWADPLETHRLREDDLDPSFGVYALQRAGEQEAAEGALFGRDAPALALRDARWLVEAWQPGAVAELLTVWDVHDPAGVGPIVPAVNATDVVLFTHVLDRSGQILAQQDRSDAPSASWRAGDVVLQVHQLAVPEGTEPGEYETVVGLYDRQSGQRLPRLDGGHAHAAVDPLLIIP
ncbi:MAG: phospholipid carrier-dependent glycosyltransferase [bacterium]